MAKVSKKFKDKVKGKASRYAGQIKTYTGGTTEEIQSSLKRKSNLFTLDAGKGTQIQILDNPGDWLRFESHNNKSGAVPCIKKGCLPCKKGEYASKRGMINVWDARDKAVKLFNANATVMSDLIARSKRLKNEDLTGYYFYISREGTTTDTVYRVDREDENPEPERTKSRKKKRIDGNEILTVFVENYYAKLKKQEDDEDEIEDEEVEDEDDELEDIEDDEDEDNTEDEEDEDEDDDEEDEDDEDDEVVLSKKDKKKKKGGKK